MKSPTLAAAVSLAAFAAHAEVTARAGVTVPDRAPAPRRDTTLRGAPMSGPYDSAFDEKCAEIRGLELHREATCTRVRAVRIGGLRAEIHQVAWADASSDYYLALRTRDGWFVSDVPLQIETASGHAGHYDRGRVDAIAVAEERIDGRAALSFQIRESWRTYRDECATDEARCAPGRAFTQSATLVCGVGAAGAPACTAPLYTVGDGDRPPRVVAGKLIARGVEVGEPTEYGQEWHALADADYEIRL
jgi:hypothetical protein